jgi:hypothetical protein
VKIRPGASGTGLRTCTGFTVTYASGSITRVISTRDLSALPAIPDLHRLTMSLATLDAIIEPQWDYRYYSFNRKWDIGEQMASMRNGQGDEWFCVFSDAGAFLKGFDHESAMSPWGTEPSRIWPGVLDNVPASFARFVSEPAFSMADTTFCIWRTPGDLAWNRGDIQFPGDDDPDGSEWMLSILDCNPQSYQEHAESYWERAVPLDLIQQVYRHGPLTEDFIRSLNPERDLESLASDLDGIGYPAATDTER